MVGTFYSEILLLLKTEARLAPGSFQLYKHKYKVQLYRILLQTLTQKKTTKGVQEKAMIKKEMAMLM